METVHCHLTLLVFTFLTHNNRIGDLEAIVHHVQLLPLFAIPPCIHLTKNSSKWQWPLSAFIVFLVLQMICRLLSGVVQTCKTCFHHSLLQEISGFDDCWSKTVNLANWRLHPIKWMGCCRPMPRVATQPLHLPLPATVEKPCFQVHDPRPFIPPHLLHAKVHAQILVPMY